MELVKWVKNNIYELLGLTQWTKKVFISSLSQWSRTLWAIKRQKDRHILSRRHFLLVPCRQQTVYTVYIYIHPHWFVYMGWRPPQNDSA